jgi:hypothetical protein
MKQATQFIRNAAAHARHTFKKFKTVSYPLAAVVLLVAGVYGTKFIIHEIRTAPDKQMRYKVSSAEERLTEQKNYVGTGDGEETEADTSSQYVCVDYKGKLPASTTVTEARAAINDINGPIAALYANGSFSADTPTDSAAYQAAAAAASSAAAHLQTAHDEATKSRDLCYIVGFLNTGVSQFTSLADMLHNGKASPADLQVAVRYASDLDKAGIGNAQQ